MISMRSFYIALLSCFLLSGCKIYRFTDASINPNIKNFFVANISNLAPIQVPTLAPDFIDKLQSKFLRESNLALTTANGDIEFEGAIVEYSIDPVSITQTETVAQNRLTIGIRIDFTNNIEPDKSFSTVFREQEVYEASIAGTEVDTRIAPVVLDKLVQTIFNKAFVNW